MKKIALLLGLMPLIVSCKTSRVQSAMPEEDARVIVYRTRTDHFRQVPITLNQTKDRVVSFPAPSDLYYEGELALPVKLNDGFLLDRRGIGPHTVFTSFTYEEYSGMNSPPSTRELLNSIIDADPFESIYDCGKAGSYQDLLEELNSKIDEGMKGCKLLQQ